MNKTIRVGYLSYGLDRAPTGIGRYAVELLIAMSALPNAPDLVLFTTEREDRYGLWEKFEHHPLPGCHLLPGLITFGNLILSQAVVSYDLDLLHDPNGIAPFLGPRFGVLRLVTIHDAFAYIYPEMHNTLDNWRYRWMLPKAARQADAVITVSETSRQDLQQHLGLKLGKIFVTAEGVKPRFQPVMESTERHSVLDRYGIKPPYLLFVGGLSARKNISRLLVAFARLRELIPEITLVICGKRQWRLEEFDTRPKQADLEDYIHFTGYVPDSDLPALYSAADVFVFPSLYEGFGLPPLEAMACGTPVVSSNAGPLKDIVGDAALTVDPYDVDGWVKAIYRLLSDRTLRGDLRRRGFRQAAHFTWKRTALQTLAIYQRVYQQALKRNPTPSQSIEEDHEY